MLRMKSPALAVALAGCLGSSCATLPSEIPTEAEHLVVVKCVRLPERFGWPVTTAEHTYYDVRTRSGWQRVEVLGSFGVEVTPIDDVLARDDERFGGRQVHVLKVYEGDAARELAPQIVAAARRYPLANDYRAFPGPNSNTFAEWISQQVPGLWIEQYGTAVGKDYPLNGWIACGVTTTRTGLEVETPFLGAQVGLVEGVELHLCCMTIGVGIWPPQLKLPLLPGLPWGLAR